MGRHISTFVALCLSLVVVDAKPEALQETSVQENAVELLISRLLPGREKEFNIVVNPEYFPDAKAASLDAFELRTVQNRRLQITATSGVAASWGFNHYLKYFCKAHVSWSGRQLHVPSPLPTIQNATKIISPNRYRYYQNVCTSSYSFVWWDWQRWEKEIDWMALNGINLPLAFTGQEEIWRRVYIALGVHQNEIDEHFAGPAFLAWGRMGNMRGWGGPLPYPSWYKSQLELQHKILKRMRSFGMTAVLPGFAGHVPAAIQRIYPKAILHRLGDWGNFNSTYCCTYFLDPNDSLFQVIGKMFIQEQMKEYNGTDHIYNADSFNEMTPPSSKPSYLASASKSILSSMQAADPNAIWLMQGWLFRQRTFWKPPQVKALLTGVPIGKMIVLDLFAEVDPVWKTTESFYGQPFIWCMLHNFGGNLGLYGTVERVAKGPVEAHETKTCTIVGTGLAPEGIEQNDFMYNLMAEMGWRRKTFDLTKWSEAYSVRRYGSADENAMKAWSILVRTVYNCSDNHSNHNHAIPVWRPSLHMTYQIWYRHSDLVEAWKNMLLSAKELRSSTTFRYDLVDIGRQVLQDVSYTLYTELMKAYKDKNIEAIDLAAEKLLGLLADLDDLMSSDVHFLLGTWLENAKRMATNVAEKSLYEFNARNQITMWGPDGNIHDYANKMWGGLIRSYYYPRWKLFTSKLRAAIRAGKEIDMKEFNQDLLRLERNWNLMSDVYPTEATGDSVLISTLLYKKYSGLDFRYTVDESKPRIQSGFSYEESGAFDDLNHAYTII